MGPTRMSRHNPRLLRAVSLYLRALHYLAMAGVATLVVVAAMQVFFRYVVGESLFWSEELMRSLMVWIAFLSAGIAYSRGEMLGMRFIVDGLRPSLTAKIDIAGRVLIVLFLLVVAWYGWLFTMRTSEQEAVSLEISLGWLHAAIPVGCLLLAIHVAFADLFRSALPKEETSHSL